MLHLASRNGPVQHRQMKTTFYACLGRGMFMWIRARHVPNNYFNFCHRSSSLLEAMDITLCTVGRSSEHGTKHQQCHVFHSMHTSCLRCLDRTTTVLFGFEVISHVLYFACVEQTLHMQQTLYVAFIRFMSEIASRSRVRTKLTVVKN